MTPDEIEAAILSDARIQPDGRRAAVAATFRQVAENASDIGFTRGNAPAVMIEAYKHSLSDRAGDTIPVAARRMTLREVTRCLRDCGGGVADDAEVRQFFYLMMQFGSSGDPRHAAIRETATRECREWNEGCG